MTPPVAPPAEPASPGRVELASGRELRRSRPGEAARCARRALLHARRAHDPALAADARRLIAQTLLLQGRPGQALPRLRAAWRSAGPAARAALAPELAACLAQVGRAEEALPLLAQARAALVEARASAPPLAFLDLAEAHVLLCLERPRAAVRLLAHARRALGRAANGPVLDALDGNRANAWSLLGRVGRAARLYQRVAARAAARGDAALTSQARYNHAYLEVLRGRYGTAGELLAALRTRFEAAGDDRHRALCELDLAELALRLEQPDAAHDHAQRAHAGLARAGLARDAARALYLAAAADVQRLPAQRALPALERAIAALRTGGCSTWEAVGLARLGQLRADLGAVVEGRALLEDAAQRLAGLGLLQREALARLALLRLDASTQGATSVRGRAAMLADLLRAVDAPWGRAEAHHLEARARAGGDRPWRAARHALRAAACLVEQRPQLPPDEPAATFLAGRASIVEDACALTSVLPSPRAAMRALEAWEAGTAAALSDLLAADARRARDVAVGETEALRARLPGRLGAGPELAAVERDLVRRTRAAGRARPRRRAREALAAVAERFAGRASVIVFAVASNGTRTFVLEDGVVTQRASADGARAWGRRIGALAGAVGAWGGTPASAPEARAALDDLATALAAALPQRPQSRRTIVVPSGPLLDAPFAALGALGGAWPGSAEVCVVPSLAALEAMACRAPLVAGRGLAMGADDLRAAQVRAEIEAVAAAHAHAPPHVDAAATRATFLEHAPSARWIHVAGHARGGEDAALRLADGWLPASDLRGLRLQAELVVLSACSGAQAQHPGLGEPGGLPRALLLAGARNVIGSLWPVEDAAAARFARHLHAALAAGAAPVDALQRSAAAVRAAFPHPRAWAGWTLLGPGDALLWS